MKKIITISALFITLIGILALKHEESKRQKTPPAERVY